MNVKDLSGHWMHSHEEDRDDELVFRPASHQFPRARGRTGFELRANGTLIEHGIGPTDQRTQTPGRWRLDGDTLKLGGQTMKVVSVAPDRLVLRKS